jgi:hypothetical protein
LQQGQEDPPGNNHPRDSPIVGDPGGPEETLDIELTKTGKCSIQVYQTGEEATSDDLSSFWPYSGYRATVWFSPSQCTGNVGDTDESQLFEIKNNSGTDVGFHSYDPAKIRTIRAFNATTVQSNADFYLWYP